MSLGCCVSIRAKYEYSQMQFSLQPFTLNPQKDFAIKFSCILLPRNLVDPVEAGSLKWEAGVIPALSP